MAAVSPTSTKQSAAGTVNLSLSRPGWVVAAFDVGLVKDVLRLIQSDGLLWGDSWRCSVSPASFLMNDQKVLFTLMMYKG